MLVAIAIMMVVTGFVVPMLRPARQGQEVRLATAELAAALRETRSLAMRHGRSQSVILDVAKRSYRVGLHRRPHSLPGELAITFDTVAGEVNSETSAGIRFFPQGGSTGGRIVLTRGNQHAEITVDWLTGRVAVSE